jgi:transposase
MLGCQSSGRPSANSAPRANDLLGRVDDAALIKLVLEAVHEFDVQEISPVRNGSRRFTPSQTATLLVYCYARGIFSSAEIENRLSLDPAISYICAGLKPDWFQLRRFRRDNSLLILGILTRLLELVTTQFGMLQASVVPERWRHEFREQALDRLRDAIQADTMASDE